MCKLAHRRFNKIHRELSFAVSFQLIAHCPCKYLRPSPMISFSLLVIITRHTRQWQLNAIFAMETASIRLAERKTNYIVQPIQCTHCVYCMAYALYKRMQIVKFVDSQTEENRNERIRRHFFKKRTHKSLLCERNIAIVCCLVCKMKKNKIKKRDEFDLINYLYTKEECIRWNVHIHRFDRHTLLFYFVNCVSDNQKQQQNCDNI